MPSTALQAALRAERVRILWEFQARQLEMHERRYLQVLAALLGAGLASVASVLLDKVPPSAGALLAAALFAGATYVHVLIRDLPKSLRASTVEIVRHVDRLMLQEEA